MSTIEELRERLRKLDISLSFADAEMGKKWNEYTTARRVHEGYCKARVQILEAIEKLEKKP